MSARTVTVTDIAPGVAFAQGPLSNWVVLVGDGEVALIDTGYPADFALLERSIARAGGAGLPITTLLVTHAHSDHIGGAARLVREFGTTVLASEDELPGVRRDVVEQITVRDLLPHAWRPRVAAWAVRAVRAGGLADVGVRSAGALPNGPLRVAGSTVVPVRVPGHTSGHTAFVLPEADALVSGDALVTAHPTTRRRGPQLLPDMFHTDPVRARAALATLAELHTGVLLPGHGPLEERAAQSAAFWARRAGAAPTLTA